LILKPTAVWKGIRGGYSIPKPSACCDHVISDLAGKVHELIAASLRCEPMVSFHHLNSPMPRTIYGGLAVLNDACTAST
jgi:hypothetical protein